MTGLADWIPSSACSMGSCVKVRHVDGHVEVRDDTAPDTVLHITPADWAAFLVGAKAGEFDGPAADTGQARETGADRAARPRRFSPEDALSVRERLGAAAQARELHHALADFLGRPVDVNPDVLMDDVRNTAAALDEIARLVGCWSEDGQHPPTVVEAVRQAMDERWSS